MEGLLTPLEGNISQQCLTDGRAYIDQLNKVTNFNFYLSYQKIRMESTYIFQYFLYNNFRSTIWSLDSPHWIEQVWKKL